MKRVTSPKVLPTPLGFLSRLTPVFSIIASVLDQLNGYALVYVGITGEAFWPSARRAVGLAKRRSGLLDCEFSQIVANARHIDQTPPHAKLYRPGCVYRDCRIPIHGAPAIESYIRSVRSCALWRCTLFSHQGRSSGSGGRVSGIPLVD